MNSASNFDISTIRLYYKDKMKSLLQTQEWATFRETQGWRVHWVDEILVLEKPLPMGLSFLYAPEVDFFQINFNEFLPKIAEISKKSHSILLRIDCLNHNSAPYGEKISKILKNKKFIKSFEEIQPEYRQIINISKSEEQILAQMKQKGRYNIKVAERSGVVVEKSDNIDDFYKIFCETAKRDGFQVRPKKYFVNLLRILKSAGLAELLVCRYNNSPVAAGIFTFCDGLASYLYGASLSSQRQVMAPYLMHWEAIKLAKEKNCHFYDLLAVSPFGSNTDQHLLAKYAGITRFKEQFGGQKYQTVGSWDLVLNPAMYQLFKLVENIRRH